MTQVTIRTNDASLCRLKGWKAGDVLLVEREAFVGRSYTRKYRLTAIGDESILVREMIPASTCAVRGQLKARLGCEVKWSRRLLSCVITKDTTALESKHA